MVGGLSCVDYLCKHTLWISVVSGLYMLVLIKFVQTSSLTFPAGTCWTTSFRCFIGIWNFNIPKKRIFDYPSEIHSLPSLPHLYTRTPFTQLLSPNLVAAVAAKSLQSCLTLCDPIDSSPPGSSFHGIFQARVLERGAIAFSPNLVMTLHFSVALHVSNVLWSLWFVPTAISLAQATSIFACRPLQQPPPSLPVSSPAPCPEICSLLSSWIGLFE